MALATVAEPASGGGQPDAPFGSRPDGRPVRRVLVRLGQLALTVVVTWFILERLGPGLVNFHWYHVALVYDGAAGALDYYLDGRRKAKLTGLPRELRAALATFGDGPAGRLDGAVDDVRWASHAMTPAEIEALVEGSIAAAPEW